jgi:hypothetical protein
MKKDSFQKTIEKLTTERIETIHKLMQLSLEALEIKKNELYELHANARDSGYIEASEVNYLKYSIVNEAYDIKKGNEEQAWDYLS